MFFCFDLGVGYDLPFTNLYLYLFNVVGICSVMAPIARIRRENITRTFCIAVAGFKPFGPLSDAIFLPKYSTPTVHVLGRTDVIVVEERAKTLIDVSENARVEYHDGGVYLSPELTFSFLFFFCARFCFECVLPYSTPFLAGFLASFSAATFSMIHASCIGCMEQARGSRWHSQHEGSTPHPQRNPLQTHVWPDNSMSLLVSLHGYFQSNSMTSSLASPLPRCDEEEERRVSVTQSANPLYPIGHFVPSKANWRSFFRDYLRNPTGNIPSPGLNSLPPSGAATPITPRTPANHD